MASWFVKPIIGYGGDNVLTGGAGADRLIGGAGNDTVIGGNGTDTAVFSGNRSTYTITYNPAAQTYTVADQRPDAPDGTDTVSGVEWFQFADALIEPVASQTVVNADGTRTTTVYDAHGAQNWSTQVSQYDSAGRLTSYTLNYDNGTKTVTSHDPANAQTWSSMVNNYDTADRLSSQSTEYDNGTRTDTYVDTTNQSYWANYSEYFDTAGRRHYQVFNNDNGTHDTYYYDAANSGNWSMLIYNYDAAWNALLQRQYNDDGRYEYVYYDPYNWYSWSWYVDRYTAGGYRFEQYGVYDNGSDWRWSAPVVLDLDGDGVEITPLASSTATFDLDGDGQRSHTAWVGADDGFLAIDLGAEASQGPDGVIDQASEIVFTQWLEGSTSDMAALRGVFDTNADGRLDAGDARWNEFRVWKDANSDGVSQAGEVVTLDALGHRLDRPQPDRCVAELRRWFHHPRHRGLYADGRHDRHRCRRGARLRGRQPAERRTRE